MSRSQQAFVKNAASKQQVAAAARAEEKRDEQLRASLLAIMRTKEGRRVMAELLERAGLYRSSFDTSGSVTYFNEGRRNFGLEIQALLADVSEPFYLAMETEMRAFKRQLAQGPAAVQTQAATEGETDGSDS